MAGRPDVTIRVDGASKLRRDLKAMGDDLSDLKDANQAAGQIVLGASHPPRKTGRLAASGRVSRAVARVSILFGGARVPWAGPIHWGWPSHNIEPNPFIVDAAQRTEPMWVELYERAIEEATDKVAGHTY